MRRPLRDRSLTASLLAGFAVSSVALSLLGVVLAPGAARGLATVSAVISVGIAGGTLARLAHAGWFDGDTVPRRGGRSREEVRDE